MQTQTVTVRAVVELYLRHCDVENVHVPDARADRLRVFDAFSKALGDVAVGDCKPFMLTDFIEGHPQWKSPATRRAKSNYIKAAFRWAAEQGRIPCNPFVVVRYPEAERRPDFPDELLEVIMRLGNKPFEYALRWLRLTACRLSELCQARWADVDLERGVWTIHNHKSRRHTKKPKLVALVPEAVALLQSMAGAPTGQADAVLVPADKTQSAYVFTNTRGTPWTRRTLGQQLRRMKERYKIPEKATLHGVRHRAASQAVANGASIKLVAAQLGHSSVGVTEKYYVHNEQLLDGMRDAARLSLPKK